MNKEKALKNQGLEFREDICVIKGGYYLVTIRKRFQEIIDDISWELQKSIPSEEQIQKVVYEKLIEQMR